MPKLEFPNINFMPSYISALREGYRIGIQKVKTEEQISAIEQDPQAFLDDFFAIKTDPVTYADGSVHARLTQTKFWFMDGNEFLGEIVIRHHLNEKTETVGGHIGYGTRPSVQGQGVATNMLKDALQFCKNDLSLDKVLISVNDTNTPSIKVIEKNGGILENKVISYFDNQLARRYWITL